MSESEKSQLVNETRWQYYGTSDTTGNLSLTWNTSVLPTQTVTIELWGYEETGGACQGPVEVLGTSDTQTGDNESQVGLEAGAWEAVHKWKVIRDLRPALQMRRVLQLDEEKSGPFWHAWWTPNPAGVLDTVTFE